MHLRGSTRPVRVARPTTPARDPEADALYRSMRDSAAYLRRMRDPEEPKKLLRHEIAERGFEAGASALGAFAVGLISGRIGQWDIPGTPLPIGLTTFVVGNAIDIYFLKGRAGPYVERFSSGALDAWTTLLGAGYGQRWREAAGQPANAIGPTAVTGALPPPSYQPDLRLLEAPGPPKTLTEAEVAAISQQVRR